MTPGQLDIEDLLADESFINYCKRTSQRDVAHWESYIQDHPYYATIIEQARNRFLELFNAFAAADMDEQETLLKNRLAAADPAPVIHIQKQEHRRKTIFSPAFQLTAAVVILALAVYYFNFISNNHTPKESAKQFATAYGERKNFQLPDGSFVVLNGGSKIKITDAYGVKARDIYLEGEAFFDVKHNKELPFIVHTSAMDVKALGTAFNVKAYPGEKMTEASLVRGLVEVTLKDKENRKVLLHPNQKVQWQLPGATPGNKNNELATTDKKAVVTDKLVQGLTKTNRDEIIEIAWTENKLIFTDETFENIAVLLERWYGVKIEFADVTIMNYRFTGIFEKEGLRAVLSFLKESRHFNYEFIPGDTLTVKLYQ
ncbi:FecR family protein [Asinibacterium sp. OR53]|uniref:FecR family protein n=1 Tax=Asinibacterium sp. OR53 TaxID=925409 RepID=UPI00047D7980|nr:FecR domain-containing protein [Asinibacterium sp. OR53]